MVKMTIKNWCRRLPVTDSPICYREVRRLFILRCVWTLSSLIVIILLLTGCAHPKFVARPIPAKIIKHSSQLLREVKGHALNVKSLRGLVRAEMKRGNDKISGKQEITIQSPDYLLVESISPFGSTVSILLATPDIMEFYEPSNNRLYKGKPIESHLTKLFPIYMDVEDLISIALNDFKLGGCEKYTVHYEREHNLYNLRCFIQGYRYEYKIDPIDFFISQVEFYKQEILIRRITFDNFRHVDGGLYPYRVNVEFPLHNAAVIFKWIELDISQSIPLERFSMPRVEDVAIISLN